MVPGLEMLHTARQETLRLLEGLDQSDLDYRPAPGKWSIGEIADHLILSEKVYREQIAELAALARAGKRPFVRKSVRDVDFSPIFLPKMFLPIMEAPFTLLTAFVPGAVREMLIRYSFLPGQAPGVANPRWGRSGAELTAGLRASIDQTAAIFESNRDLDFHAMKAQHAMLGTNSVPELLRITALHEQRHQRQIESVRKRLVNRRATAA